MEDDDQRSRKKPRYEEEHQNSSPSWIDLPQDVLAFIHNKLYVVDQIRYRAVCKSWRIPEYHCFNHLMPWAVSYSWKDPSTTDPYGVLPFEYEITNPLSKQIHTFTNKVVCCWELLKGNFLSRIPTYGPTVYATFQGGWALVGWHFKFTASFFVHNVFTNQLIRLHHVHTSRVRVATFLNDHTQIFILCDDACKPRCCFTATTNTTCRKWCSRVFCETRFIDDSVIDVQYMKGHDKVYILYACGMLQSFSLGAKPLDLDKICTFKGPSLIHETLPNCWLVDKDKQDLIMVTKNESEEWLIFKFDLSQMCWINIETSFLKNTAIFTKSSASAEESSASSFLTTSVVTKEEENNNMQQDCRIFFEDNDEDHNIVRNCYSVAEKKLLKSEEYRWRRQPFKRLNFFQLNTSYLGPSNV